MCLRMSSFASVSQVSGQNTAVNTCYLMRELKKGDRVWVRQNADSCAWASFTSTTITFSGVLLAREGVSTLGAQYGSGSSCPLPRLGLSSHLVSGSPGHSVALSGAAITLLLCFLFLG